MPQMTADMERYLGQVTILHGEPKTSNAEYVARFAERFGNAVTALNEGATAEQLVQGVRDVPATLAIARLESGELIASAISAGLIVVMLNSLRDADSKFLICGKEPRQCCAALSALFGEAFAPTLGNSLKDVVFRITAGSADSDYSYAPGFERTLKKLDEAGAIIVANSSPSADAELQPFMGVLAENLASKKLEVSEKIIFVPCHEPGEVPHALAVSHTGTSQELANIAMALEAVVALPEQQFLRWMI